MKKHPDVPFIAIIGSPGIRVHDFQSALLGGKKDENLLSLQVTISPVIGKQSVCVGGYEAASAVRLPRSAC